MIFGRGVLSTNRHVAIKDEDTFTSACLCKPCLKPVLCCVCAPVCPAGLHVVCRPRRPLSPTCPAGTTLGHSCCCPAHAASAGVCHVQPHELETPGQLTTNPAGQPGSTTCEWAGRGLATALCLLKLGFSRVVGFCALRLEAGGSSDALAAVLCCAVPCCIVLQQFFGGVDEAWFRLVHVAIEAAAAPAIAALRPLQAAAQQVKTMRC